MEKKSVAADRGDKCGPFQRAMGVAAVDGAEIPAQLRYGLDTEKFRHNNGREVLAGEYGCYRSHPIRTVVDNGYDLAIIAEDDIRLNGELEDRLLAIFEAQRTIGLLKLVNHRTEGFISYGSHSLGDVFGRRLRGGPHGSAAFYAVTRKAARLLPGSFEPVWLPAT